VVEMELRQRSTRISTLKEQLQKLQDKHYKQFGDRSIPLCQDSCRF